MALMPRCLGTARRPRTLRVAGSLLVGLVALLTAGSSAAQQPDVHYWNHAGLPTGAIGSWQLQRGGPLPCYFQPVEIQGPQGLTVSLAAYGQFQEPQAAPLRAGLQVGKVYRLRVMGIPLHEGEELFPTIEILDRLYTPRGQELRFAVPIELNRDDLELALQGKFITRVIYTEDPQNALPWSEPPQGHNWFEVGPQDDPMFVADTLGRPIAILRVGARVPTGQMDMGFLYGCPPYLALPPRTNLLTPPPGAAAPAADPVSANVFFQGQPQ